MSNDATRTMLEFASSQSLITVEQTVSLMATAVENSEEVLDELAAAGLLRRLVVLPGEVGYAITGDGLAAVDSKLSVSTFGGLGVRRAIAAGWLWLRSRDGRFAGAEVLSRRELTARDADAERSLARGGRPTGLRVPGFSGPDGSELQYPDVLLAFPGAWLAVHVQFDVPDRRWLAALLRAYGADERYERIVFVVEEELVAGQIEAAARSAGVATMTFVQWMEWPLAAA